MTNQNERIETQIEVLEVRDDGWKHSLDLNIPGFGDRPFRFVAWPNNQGPAPKRGGTMLGTLQAWRRSQFYVRQGKLTEGDVDGTEEKWMLDWNLLGVRPLDTVAAADTAGKAPDKVPDKVPPTVFLDGNTRYRVDQEGINDREAVRLVLTHGASDGANIYADMAVVLAEAAGVAEWLNERLAVRLAGGLVGAAQEAGAVVTDVADEAETTPDDGAEPMPRIRNKADLSAWVEDQGYATKEISHVLEGAGFGDSGEYLAADGNTPQGLAELLLNELEIGGSK